MPNYCEITSYTREVKHSRLFIIKLLFTTPHFIPVVTPLSVPLCDVITPTLAAQCRSLPMPDDVRNPRRFWQRYYIPKRTGLYLSLPASDRPPRMCPDRVVGNNRVAN